MRSALKNYTKVSDAFYLVLITLVTVFPSLVLGTDMPTVMCSAADIVLGEVSSALATIGIASLGIGACFGKVSWPAAITVTAGVAGLFAAGYLAQLLGTQPGVLGSPGWAPAACP